MSKRLHHHNPAAHPRLRLMSARRKDPSARSVCEPHELILLCASATAGPEPRETDGCPSFLEKRDRRERSFLTEKCQITRTQIHTSLKRLTSARHNNGRKSLLPVECMLQTKESLKTKKRMMYSHGALLYCGYAGSDVIGCRRPTSWVFVCMLQTRVTLTAFPIATPRGCSLKFP